jgi:hypothetical protein
VYNPWKITLHPRCIEHEFYQDFVNPQLKKIFNYDPKFYINEKQADHSKFPNSHSKKKKLFSLMHVNINSVAVVSWLTKDLGFKIFDGNRERILPDLNWSNQEILQGFFEGFIAGRGRVYLKKDDYGLSFRVPEYNESTRNAITELLEMNSINYKSLKTGIHLNQYYTNKVLTEYTILNPIHKQRMEESNIDIFK